MLQEPIGMVIEGRYSLGSRVGADGPIETYFALDTQSCEPVSVLFLKTPGIPSDEARAEFESRAHRLAMLSHPSLVEVLAYGVHEGMAYLVTADADSANLGRMLERGADLGLERSIRVLSQINEALELAHSSGFQHGRFRPEHVFFAADGRAVLSGVGALQLLESLGVSLPESANDVEKREATDRSALWSIGLRAIETQPTVTYPMYSDLAGAAEERTSFAPPAPAADVTEEIVRWTPSEAKRPRARLPLVGACAASALLVLMAVAFV
jgi:serine/threonine protein kinase